ncbi:MAG: hypothetical protein U9N40_02095 [Euryarchaeota archaeon]|nr:hypothetical protein [Euryarchaeota archaeon]
MHFSKFIRNLLYTGLLCLLAVSFVSAASAAGAVMEEEWNNTYQYGKYTDFFTVLQTDCAGYILGGLGVNPGGNNALLLKTDASGAEVWNRSFAGDRVSSVEITPQGNYVLLTFKEVLEYDNESLGSDAIMIGASADSHIISVDENGTVLFDTEIPGLRANSVKVMPDGNYAVTGWTWSDDLTTSSLIGLYDDEGNKILSSSVSAGAAYDLAVAGDNLYVSGISSLSDSDIGKKFSWFICLDNAGKKIYKRTYENVSFYSVIPSSEAEEGFLLSGSALIPCTAFSPDGFETRAYAMKTDESGKEEWSHILQGYECYGACELPGNGYILSGLWGDNGMLQMLDYSGMSVSTVIYNKGEEPVQSRLGAVALTDDGGCISSGWTRMTGNVEGWLVKSDISGGEPVVPTKPAETPGFTVISVIAALGMVLAVRRVF